MVLGNLRVVMLPISAIDRSHPTFSEEMCIAGLRERPYPFMQREADTGFNIEKALNTSLTRVQEILAF